MRHADEKGPEVQPEEVTQQTEKETEVGLFGGVLLKSFLPPSLPSSLSKFVLPGCRPRDRWSYIKATSSLPSFPFYRLTH